MNVTAKMNYTSPDISIEDALAIKKLNKALQDHPGEPFRETADIRKKMREVSMKVMFSGGIKPSAVDIIDARKLDDFSNPRVNLSPQGPGFTFFKHPVGSLDFYDKKSVETVYWPKLIELAKDLLGATHAQVISFATRNVTNPKGRKKNNLGAAAHIVHNDFAADPGLQQRLANMLARDPSTLRGNDKEQHRLCAEQGITSEKVRAAGRVVILNVWRSIDPEDHPIQEQPFALLDRRSVLEEEIVQDCLPAEPGKPEVVGIDRALACRAVGSPRHKWYYWPGMKRDEAMAFFTYDSAAASTPVMHSAFNDPKTPEDAPPRQSCECRLLCLLPPQSRM